MSYFLCFSTAYSELALGRGLINVYLTAKFKECWNCKFLQFNSLIFQVRTLRLLEGKDHAWAHMESLQTEQIQNLEPCFQYEAASPTSASLSSDSRQDEA